ncbi:hypothetical protein DUI87_24700 [Hirundo rustica rustica]|uniref:Uncharacterized protein n=1 Tax=Hirundo rustica rustica TaxID=333673 RepID=A0A3M0JU97_HIRRU|nr:hypothetical protein DUI87_24700 [Hirundo rustica rustica]
MSRKEQTTMDILCVSTKGNFDFCSHEYSWRNWGRSFVADVVESQGYRISWSCSEVVEIAWNFGGQRIRNLAKTFRNFANMEAFNRELEYSGKLLFCSWSSRQQIQTGFQAFTWHQNLENLSGGFLFRLKIPPRFKAEFFQVWVVNVILNYSWREEASPREFCHVEALRNDEQDTLTPSPDRPTQPHRQQFSRFCAPGVHGFSLRTPKLSRISGREVNNPRISELGKASEISVIATRKAVTRDERFSQGRDFLRSSSS